MSNEFSPDADDQGAQKKSSQQRLLLLLLLLILLFVYLYFFTGLIKPRPEQAAAPEPVQQASAPTVVKKPLPPRPQGQASSAHAAAKPGAPAGAAAKPQTAAAPEAKPAAPAAAAKPAPGAPAAKPGQPAAPAPAAKAAAEAKPAKPAAPAKAEKGAPAAPGTAKPAVAAKEGKPAAAAKEAKPAAGVKEAKPAAAAKETKPAAKEAKPAAVAKVEKVAPSKGAKPQAKAAAGAYALELDNDLAESEIGAVTAKLKKAGIANVVKTKSQKGEPMHRLFLADFGNREEAAEELDRLKTVAPNAFMLKENGRYAVYAGSFMREGKAAVEQDRLYDKGVRLVLKNATIPVSVVKLRAGSFPDPTSAEKAAAGLKSSGLSARVVKVGK